MRQGTDAGAACGCARQFITTNATITEDPPVTMPAKIVRRTLPFDVEDVNDDMFAHPGYLAAFRAAAESVRLELVLATPEWCAEVLAKSTRRNRKVSAGNVAQLCDAITRGAYRVAEVVIFDHRNNLLDGQHRLMSVIKTGIPVPLLCLYGIDPEAFAVIDTGKKRNAADVLSIEGEENTNAISAALSWVWREENGRIINGQGSGVPTDTVTALLAKHPGIRAAAKWAAAHDATILSPSVVTWLKYRMSFKDAALAEAFFLKILRGTGIADGSHEHLLRRRLENMIGKDTHEVRLERAALVVKTWNRIRAAEPARKVLVWDRDREGFPEVA